MPNLKTIKTNFTSGEISPGLLGRGDLRAYENGAMRLRNVVVAPTGGASRRPGLAYIDTADGKGRLVGFEFNTEQVYLLVFTDGRMDVYQDGAWVAGKDVPWTEAQLAQLSWTQSADTLLVTHPDVQPRKITRSSHVDWSVAVWSFTEESNLLRQPYHKFTAPEVTLTPSATSGSITLTASANLFDAAHVGQRFRIKSKQVAITAVSSPTSASAETKEDLEDTSATEDWDEAAFSSLRGWPVCCCFHQDRLVIGGSRDLPNRMWLSKSSELWNFDLGEGLDDESIEFTLLSDQVNAVRAVFSGRHLQVLTSGAEWMVTGSPLTPGKIQVNRQTRNGSMVDRQVPPRDVDGATIFAGRTGNDLREFLYTDIEQAYTSHDLAMLAGHLCNGPVDMDYDPAMRLLYVVMSDGSIAAITNYRAEQVTAWSLLTTDGLFHSVAVVGDSAYVLVERQGDYLIECFDPTLNTDSALLGEGEEPGDIWSGLDHLEGRTVSVVGDGLPVGSAVIEGGSLLLDHPATTVEAGLAFMHEIQPLPPAGQVKPVRLISAAFRLQDTQALRVDVGKGAQPIPFKHLGVESALDAPAQPFSGEVKLRALGWRRNLAEPLWVVRQSDPLPSTVLSVTTETKVSD
ncbi:MAG: hypothetical protein HQL44_12210 [Alphaproteobacteria bacterium]|nr:hypothetical protein [Alphaproteobacteria bacterium]